MKREKFAIYLRTFIFGVEDSLVSTVGLLSGVAIADVPKPTIVLTGIVLIFVEAFSMGVGNLLSEHTADEYLNKSEQPISKAILGGLLMFVSYFVAGFVPLSPYIFLSPVVAFWSSIAASMVALFILGIFGARVLKLSMWRHGLQMLLLGGGAIILGVVVGNFVHSM